jgi:putative membrane protein
MNAFTGNLLNIVIGIGIIFLILAVGAFVFSRLTRFNDAAEINKGNEAAGVYMGSKLLGLCIIVGMVSFSSHDWTSMLIWSGIGILVLCLVYLVFDWLTPRFKVCDQIAAGNMAVAQMLRSIIIGVSIVIGTILM